MAVSTLVSGEQHPNAVFLHQGCSVESVRLGSLPTTQPPTGNADIVAQLREPPNSPCSFFSFSLMARFMILGFLRLATMALALRGALLGRLAHQGTRGGASLHCIFVYGISNAGLDLARDCSFSASESLSSSGSPWGCGCRDDVGGRLGRFARIR